MLTSFPKQQGKTMNPMKDLPVCASCTLGVPSTGSPSRCLPSSILTSFRYSYMPPSATGLPSGGHYSTLGIPPTVQHTSPLFCLQLIVYCPPSACTDIIQVSQDQTALCVTCSLVYHKHLVQPQGSVK